MMLRAIAPNPASIAYRYGLMCGFLSIMTNSIPAAGSRNPRSTYQILLLLRQMCIFSASWISSSRKSG